MTLLEPAFVRELEALRRRMIIRARSGGAGDRVARRKGSSAEFEEHRAYVPGDDLRRVDWLAYARTGSPVLKTFRAEEDAVLRVVLDASASLDFGDPRKLDAAVRLTAAFGYLALAGAQRAQVLVARSDGGSRGVQNVAPPRRGRGGLVGLLRDLDRVTAQGPGDLARAIADTLLQCRRPGLLVVVSDFMDPGPVTAALTRARAAGHELALVQVLAREELEPDLEGDFALVDAETGAEVELTADADAVAAYMLRVTGLVEELRSWARQHGASYVRLVTDEPLEGAVRRFVSREVD